MHKLLERQIARYLGQAPIDPRVARLLDAVDRAYAQADADRLLVERSLELTSQELLEMNRQLRQELAERTAAQAAIRESEERYHLVSRAISDAVWDWDLASDEVVWSENMHTHFGHTAGRIVSGAEAWKELIHPDDRARVIAGLEAFLGGRAETWSDEYRFRCADGRYADVVDRGILIRGPEGHPVRMIGALTEVTREKQMQERLLLAERMASLGTLAAGVAHEINNPLAYVLGNIEYLGEELARSRCAISHDLAAKLSEAVAESKDGANRVRAIVRDMKTLSRADDQTRTQVDLRAAIRSASAMSASQIRHRAKLVMDLQPVPRVAANEGRIGQVFVNLIVNAAQSIPEGAADRNEIRLSTRVDARGRVVAEVKDTGMGIPPHVRGRIFDPFFTTKRVGEGTGLGLSICHGIVTGLGGEIEVDTEVGKGSTFRVILPPAPGVRATSIAAPAETAAKRVRILIVDDEPMVGRTLTRILGREHEVVSLTSAPEALARIRRGDEFSLILCDLMMPEMTGMDVYAEIRRHVPALGERVIFMTGGAFTPRARAFLEGVPNARVEKPFTASSIREVIREALADLG